LKEVFGNRQSSFYKGALKFNRKSKKEMLEDVHMRSHSHERDITAEVFCTLHCENEINLQARVQDLAPQMSEFVLLATLQLNEKQCGRDSLNLEE
jgi:hypothetical protein